MSSAKNNQRKHILIIFLPSDVVLQAEFTSNVRFESRGVDWIGKGRARICTRAGEPVSH